MAIIDIARQSPRDVSPGLKSVLLEWSEKSEAYFGFPIPVEVIAQSDSPYADDRSQVNTAIINSRSGNDWALLVILADVANAPDELIAHEILHKTLEFDGYRDLRHQEMPNSPVQTIMNSMLAHIPLNERMRRHGLDPGVIEEPKAQGGLDRIDKFAAFEGTVPVLLAACLYADSILQASQELSDAIRLGIRKFPEVSRLSEAVIAAIRQHDLSQPEEYRVLCNIIADVLNLKEVGNFVEYDHMAEMKRYMKSNRQVVPAAPPEGGQPDATGE